ncbi:MAG: hypothetical protein K0V04_35105, partial [Deltaproteobacteria bacterium]|nr:hypothetical protein [Deltaproteobacteria bacterium]
MRARKATAGSPSPRVQDHNGAEPHHAPSLLVTSRGAGGGRSLPEPHHAPSLLVTSRGAGGG